MATWPPTPGKHRDWWSPSAVVHLDRCRSALGDPLGGKHRRPTHARAYSVWHEAAVWTDAPPKRRARLAGRAA